MTIFLTIVVLSLAAALVLSRRRLRVVTELERESHERVDDLIRSRQLLRFELDLNRSARATKNGSFAGRLLVVLVPHPKDGYAFIKNASGETIAERGTPPGRLDVAEDGETLAVTRQKSSDGFLVETNRLGASGPERSEAERVFKEFLREAVFGLLAVGGSRQLAETKVRLQTAVNGESEPAVALPRYLTQLALAAGCDRASVFFSQKDGSLRRIATGTVDDRTDPRTDRRRGRCFWFDSVDRSANRAV